MAEDMLKKDISILKLLNYNLLFFIPLFLMYIIARVASTSIGSAFEISPSVATQILMHIFTLIMFFVIIPFIRVRESIKGVRFAFFNFIIVGLVITIPSVLQNNYSVLFGSALWIANFIFVTFITCPDVIGISGDPEDWFKHKVQLYILIIYVIVVVLYIIGFGSLYLQIFQDPVYKHPFNYFFDAEAPTYWNFIYFSGEVMASGGSGNIVPASSGARVVKTLQSMISMILNLIFISTLIMYVSYAQSTVAERAEKKIEHEEEDIKRTEERIMKEEERELEDIERSRATPSIQYRQRAQESTYPNYMNGYENFKR